MRPLALVSLCAAALASCGTDVCAQLRSISWPTLQGGCADAGLPPGAGACEQDLSACSAADRSTLSGYVGCLSHLPACAPAGQAVWTQELASCQALRQTLSTACPFYLAGGTSVVGGPGPPGDGGCHVDDDCAPVDCPCTDVDGGSATFQQCLDGGCNPTCPELFCCQGEGLGPGDQCASPCACASSICGGGVCS